MDIKDITKMTREEFIAEIEKTDGLYKHSEVISDLILCPDDINLKGISTCEKLNCSCKECWLRAIKDVKFKNE